MNNNTFGTIKRILLILFIIVLVGFIIALLVFMPNKKLINNIKTFININTKVLYISNKENFSDYPIELLKKYEIEYMYIDSSKLTSYEKNQIKKIIKTSKFSNIIAVFENGKLIDTISNFKNEDEVIKFFQKYEVIPEIIGDIGDITSNIESLVLNDLMILYFPYKYTDDVEKQDIILKKIALENNIKYQMINAYLLSKNQQEKLNSLLKISSVEDQIVILVKEQKIIGSIRGINRKSEYISKMKDFEIISKMQNYMKKIDYSKFCETVYKNEKSIVVITKEDCKYCDDVIDILNKIVINYEIEINYIDIENLDSNTSKKVEEKLIELEYSDGFTTPITFIFESNKILDYVIGPSTEQYFIDIFSENGIIK